MNLESLVLASRVVNIRISSTIREILTRSDVTVIPEIMDGLLTISVCEIFRINVECQRDFASSYGRTGTVRGTLPTCDSSNEPSSANARGGHILRCTCNVAAPNIITTFMVGELRWGRDRIRTTDIAQITFGLTSSSNQLYNLG